MDIQKGEKMNVLIVNTSDAAGGAAIAAHRLCNALRKNGVRTTMLVAQKETADPDVHTACPPWEYGKNFLTERARICAANRLRRRNLFAVDIASDGTDITRTREFQEADVVHLHWVNQGFLSLHGLGKLLHSGKRIVWTMHDQWPATGICHYSGDCDRFRQECNHCPLLHKPGRKDLSNRVFRRKRILYQKASDLTFVACSHWLEEQAHLSMLLRDKVIHCIPNPLDTDTFSPGDRIEARKVLSLPLKKRLILFGSQKVTDERKGIRYLAEMAHILKGRHHVAADTNIGFIVMGQHAEHLAELLSMPVYPMGYVSTTERLVDIYRAADAFITPSLSDNLPNTIAEAMACGTPCVGFRAGGIPEMIDHMSNGYVANYKDARDLADGVEFVLGNPLLGEAASYYASYHYAENRIAHKFIELYEG